MTNVNISTVHIRSNEQDRLCYVHRHFVQCIHSAAKNTELNKLFNGVDGYVPTNLQPKYIANGNEGKNKAAVRLHNDSILYGSSDNAE